MIRSGNALTDVFSPEERSRIMRLIKNKNTGPEKFVRSMIHAMGFRFRLHRKDLPGSPDIVFPKFRKVIFVHGCFWHAHSCKRFRLPKENREYWQAKLLRNKARDRRNIQEIKKANWRSLTIWECQLRFPKTIVRKLKKFLH